MIHRKNRFLIYHVAFVLLGFAASLGAQSPSMPAAGSASIPAQDWKTFSYPEDGFSASFPSEPQMQKKDIPTAKGSFELRLYLAVTDPVAVFVGVCDYGTAVASADQDTVLQGAENGALTNSNSHLISDKKITLGVHHGIAFEADGDTTHLSARLYMVGTTLYQTLVISPIGKPYEGAARFHDSFQLIARTAK